MSSFQLQLWVAIPGSLTGGLTDSVIDRVRRRMERWAGYNLYQSIFRQAAIRDGINDTYKEIDHCMRKLSVNPAGHSLCFLLLTGCIALGPF